MARAGHVPDTDNRRGLSFRRLERTKTRSTIEGRVSWKK
jgi:hypothetical protein